MLSIQNLHVSIDGNERTLRVSFVPLPQTLAKSSPLTISSSFRLGTSTPILIASGCAGTGRELSGLVDLRKVGGVVASRRARLVATVIAAGFACT